MLLLLEPGGALPALALDDAISGSCKRHSELDSGIAAQEEPMASTLVESPSCRCFAAEIAEIAALEAEGAAALLDSADIGA
jgi:hypothetical protein